MTFHQVNSSSAKEGDLNGELFAGDHDPEGAWASLKGKDLTPPELSYSESSNSGDPRFNGEVTGPQGWEASIVTSGPYDPNSMTRGGGAMAK